jgi:hypothetical protein
MNNRKQFLEIVQMLAANDRLILNTVQLVTEEALPAYPGAAALEFLAAMEKLKPLLAECTTLSLRPGRHELQVGNGSIPKASHKNCQAAINRKERRKGLPLADALRVKSAEYWLGLGQPAEAMLQLDKVSEDSKKHAWFLKTQISAVGALRMSEHETSC